MAPRTPGCQLGRSYHSNWRELAGWAIASSHGAAARFAIMFAFSLRWPSVADGEHVKYVRPRVWKVTMPCGAETQRVSLFEDALVEELLDSIRRTAEMPIHVFPKLPCGSRRSEDWAHSYASRNQYRGVKNFVALCRRFDVDANTKWSPLDIYAASMSVFRAMFAWQAGDEDELLCKQLGTKSGCRAHNSLRWFKCPVIAALHEGALRSEGQETICTSEASLSMVEEL